MTNTTCAPRLPDDLIAAIVAEAKHGVDSYRIIGARYGVSRMTVRKYAYAAGIRRYKSPGQRPEVACLSCGRPCRSIYRLCRGCKVGQRDLEPEVPSEDVIALTGGRWVTRAGVQRWEEGA